MIPSVLLKSFLGRPPAKMDDPNATSAAPIQDVEGELTQVTILKPEFMAMLEESGMSIKVHVDQRFHELSEFMMNNLKISNAQIPLAESTMKETANAQDFVGQKSLSLIKSKPGYSAERMMDDVSRNENFDAEKSVLGCRKRKPENEDNTEVQYLRAQLASMKEHCESQETKNATLQTQLQDLEQKNAKLRGQVTKYKKILSESDGDSFEEVADSKIAEMYTGLRSQIQHIVSQYYRLRPDYPPVLPEDGYTVFNDFVKIYNVDIDAEGLRLRFRSLLFTWLHRFIFSQGLFGLVNGDEQDSLALLESRLTVARQGYDSEILEWRAKTLKCLASLQETNKQSKDFAINAYYKLRPFIRVGPNVPRIDIRNDLFALLHQLFSDAHNLALLLRRSKHHYKVEMPRQDTEFNDAEAVVHDTEKVSHEVGKTPGAVVVGWCIFGALVKYPEGDLRRRILLEKAHLIARRC